MSINGWLGCSTKQYFGLNCCYAVRSGPAGPGLGLQTILDYINDNCNFHCSLWPPRHSIVCPHENEKLVVIFDYTFAILLCTLI